MKNKNKKSIFTDLKEISKEQKAAHKQQVSDKIEKIQSNYLEILTTYNEAKKLRWYDYLIIISISSFLIGLSFIIGIFALNQLSKTEWICTSFTVIFLIAWWTLNAYKNSQAAKFYNDKRRRYQSTYTDEEAILKRISKILFFIFLILLITSITMIIIFW